MAAIGNDGRLLHDAVRAFPSLAVLHLPVRQGVRDAHDTKSAQTFHACRASAARLLVASVAAPCMPEIHAKSQTDRENAGLVHSNEWGVNGYGLTSVEGEGMVQPLHEVGSTVPVTVRIRDVCAIVYVGDPSGLGICYGHVQQYHVTVRDVCRRLIELLPRQVGQVRHLSAPSNEHRAPFEKFPQETDTDDSVFFDADGVRLPMRALQLLAVTLPIVETQGMYRVLVEVAHHVMEEYSGIHPTAQEDNGRHAFEIETRFRIARMGLGMVGVRDAMILVSRPAHGLFVRPIPFAKWLASFRVCRGIVPAYDCCRHQMQRKEQIRYHSLHVRAHIRVLSLHYGIHENQTGPQSPRQRRPRVTLTLQGRGVAIIMETARRENPEPRMH